MAAVVVVAAALAGCSDGGDAESSDAEGGSGDRVPLSEQIEASEDCDELAMIRADQRALADQQEGANAHTGFAIAARARMEALGCDIDE